MLSKQDEATTTVDTYRAFGDVWMFGYVVFETHGSGQTDRQTDIHAHPNTLHLYPNEEILIFVSQSKPLHSV